MAKLQKVTRDEKISLGMATLHFTGKLEISKFIVNHYGIRARYE